jgi:hypothetical protein
MGQGERLLGTIETCRTAAGRLVLVQRRVAAEEPGPPVLDITNERGERLTLWVPPDGMVIPEHVNAVARAWLRI